MSDPAPANPDVAEEVAEALVGDVDPGRLESFGYDEKRDRIWADGAMYVLVDRSRMEEFVVGAPPRRRRSGGRRHTRRDGNRGTGGGRRGRRTVIRLDRVELLHWDIQPHQVLLFSRGITLLTGENGSGKTSILDAIKVGLGARRLDGDRDIDGYLTRQARPVAMVRILADNRAQSGTRQRPFDRLGDLSADLVTLAVVFRPEDEGRYQREYYLLDGDVLPPLDGRRGEQRPLPSAADYRQRLAKVGLTDRYLKLLCLPQGQIASLCRRDPQTLFDDLFDIIGGRQALEAWEERLKELRETERQFSSAREELLQARSRLEALGSRVRRHEDWKEVDSRRRGIAKALPHVELREARARAVRLGEQVARLAAEVERHEGERDRARESAGAARLSLQERGERKRAVKLEIEDLRRRRNEAAGRAAEARSRVNRLEELRQRGEGIAWEDAERLRADLEKLQAARAALGAARQAQEHEREQAESDLASIRRGLLPLPKEVTRFRERLRTEGVDHSLLHEVVDVEDSTWQPAIEGFLGRFRFAVLVRDLASWSRAAALAREERYPHGVLAPDVRGHSPVDEESVFSRLKVRDPDYRALIARLLRPVAAGEPPSPLEPARRGEILSQTGFLVSRIEARHAQAEKLYLGQEARRRQEQELVEQLSAISRAEVAADEQDRAMHDRGTGISHLVSMPTSADVAQCGEWLSATWTSTKSRGGFDPAGRPVLAPFIKLGFAEGARDG